jgi:uncharacterized membrane protein
MTMNYIVSALIVIIAFGIGKVYYRKKQNKVFDRGTLLNNQKHSFVKEKDNNLKPAIGLIIVWTSVFIALAITAYLTIRR